MVNTTEFRFFLKTILTIGVGGLVLASAEAYAANGSNRGQSYIEMAVADDASSAQERPKVAKRPLRQPPPWFSNDKAAEALLKAANDGDLKKLRAALKLGTPVNVKSKRGFTALGLAARENHLEALKILIAAGADVNATYWDRTWLHWSSLSGQIKVVKLLIDAGAKVNTTYYENSGAGGETPLIGAAREGQTEIVKILIAAGADVNAVMSWNRTALYFVAKEKNPELLSVLLKAGADPNIADDQGMTPLMQAVMAGQTENAKLLIAAKADVNATVRMGDGCRSAIVMAVMEHQWEIADALLDAGADVKGSSKIFNIFGITPLMIAVSTSVKGGNDSSAQLRVIQKMIKAGANVNAQGRLEFGGATALHIAADTGDEAIVQLLIEAGANVNAKDKEGRTPLDVARSDKSPGYCRWGDGDEHEGMCRPPLNKPRSDKVKELIMAAGVR